MFIFWKVFGGLDWGKNGEATKGKGSIVKCGETRFEGGRLLKISSSLPDVPLETVEYIWVNIWCILYWILSQNFRNTFPLHSFDQLLRSAKNDTLFYLFNPGSHTNWMDQYQTLNVAVLLLSKILGSSIQLYEIQSKS